MAQQEERWLQQWEWLLDADDSDGSDVSSIAGLASGGLAPSPAGPGQARISRSSSAGGVGGGDGGEQGAAPPRTPPRVVAVHEGSGQVAGPGYHNPEWVDGRLLVFADGSLTFVWGEGLEQVTEMRRLKLKR